MERKLLFPEWFRVLSMISILLCHMVQQSKYQLMIYSAQFFNVGVENFFLLSGFLFGIRGGGIKDPLKWYSKRMKRIFIPFEVFVLLLGIVHLFTGRSIWKIDWLLLALGCQGTVVGVLGAEQTWYISAILICYLFTPLMPQIIKANDTKHKSIFLLFAFLMIPGILALTTPRWVQTLFGGVGLYGIGYLLGEHSEMLHKSKKSFLIATAGALFAVLLRLLGRYYYDDTFLYDRVIANYSSIVLSISLLFLCVNIFSDIKPKSFVQHLSAISFEIYLCHYMFCVGPLKVYGLTGNWVVESLAVVVISYMIARLVHFCSNKIIEVLP